MNLQEKGSLLGRSTPNENYGSSTFSEEAITSNRVLSHVQGMHQLLHDRYICTKFNLYA